MCSCKNLAAFAVSSPPALPVATGEDAAGATEDVVVAAREVVLVRSEEVVVVRRVVVVDREVVRKADDETA